MPADLLRVILVGVALNATALATALAPSAPPESVASNRVEGRSPLPATLLRALDRERPDALADTTLPRLAHLDDEQRAAVADRVASWDIGRRVAAWAFLQVGVPYQLGALGEEAPPDTQPVIQFLTTDCAVLNLVSAALAHARETGNERSAMALANYRDGVISYAARLHFTTDRLDASPYYRDITRSAGGTACRSRVVTLNRKTDGGRWIPIEWSRRRVVHYVPRALGGRFARWHDQGRLPAATGVAFVQTSKMSNGLDVVHESLLWRGRTILHASSLSGRVVTMPWPEFLVGPGRRYDGFVLFEYR